MPRKEQNVWNRFAIIYDRFIKKDENTYQEIIRRIVRLAKAEERVLEIATGTGMIALGLAGQITQIEAVDFSSGMIQAAQKKALELGIRNVHFSVQDACSLPYASGSFDIVVISNTLHIMPEPERALAEIKRVLKPEGLMIAPTYLHSESKKTAFLSLLMMAAGFRAYHRWTQQSYRSFLEQNGFTIVEFALYPASFPLAYAVAKKRGNIGRKK